MDYIIKDENLTYTVSSLGAELISVKNAMGDEFMWQADETFWGNHAPLLFPICGRLKNFFYMYEGKRYDMGIHGFLRRLEFTVVENDDSHLVMTVSENEETLKEYPFNFTFTVCYTVKEGKLLSTYTVKNDNDKVMPFAFGLHPGFNIFTDGGITVDDYKLIFDTESAERRTYLSDYPEGPEYLPVKFENNEYGIDSREIARVDTIILRDAGCRSRLVCERSTHEIDMEFSENLPIYCIWKNPSPEAQYLCLEPWTTAPARWVEVEELMTRKNMIHLPAGKTESFFCNFKFLK